MFRSFQAVLQPTGRQADALGRLLASQRELYNAGLEERIGAWRWECRYPDQSCWRIDDARRGVGRIHLLGVGSVRFRGAKRGSRRRRIAARQVGRLHRKIATYKAAEAGRDVIAVNPRYTSQTCHTCGHVDAGNRHATMFRCTSCGHVDHADMNAARNILRAGLAHRHEREAHERVA